MEDIAKRIIKYRAKNGLTQLQMAEKLKLSWNSVCRIENGLQNPGKLTIARLEMLEKGEIK